MDMLDEKGMERAWSQTYGLFIEPKLNRRSDITWEDVHEVLIKLPKDKEPIVEFNEEVRFIYAVEDPNTRIVGEGLAVHEIGEIRRIVPPTVDQKYVAYVYAWRAEKEVYMTFDFSPNHPDFDGSSHELSQGLGFHLKCKVIERTIPNLLQCHSVLLQHGLAMFPRLLNYPLNQMVKFFDDGNPEEAFKLLEEYVNTDKIRTAVAYWNRVDAFVTREPLFTEAVEAHANGWFHLSINALIGHIEGTITDWLYKEVEAPDTVPRGYKDRIETFKGIIKATETPEFAVSKMIESICEFLTSPETILQGRFDWSSPSPNVDSPHRHIVAHGKYIPKYYTKVNSIKMFLVLDTICFSIECYEEHKHNIQRLQTP